MSKVALYVPLEAKPGKERKSPNSCVRRCTLALMLNPDGDLVRIQE